MLIPQAFSLSNPKRTTFYVRHAYVKRPCRSYRVEQIFMGTLVNARIVGFFAAVMLLAGCGGPRPDAPLREAISEQRAAALEQTLGLADQTQIQTKDFLWVDAERAREVPVRVYLPRQVSANKPMVVVSHGIGGSRFGYSYIGKHLAGLGHAVMHVQHVGSDHRLWGGNPLLMVTRLQEAASPTEAVQRVLDVQFALDQLQGQGLAVDTSKVIGVGHSYGANTMLILAGAAVGSVNTFAQGDPADTGLSKKLTLGLAGAGLQDRRLVAVVILSAPPFYGQGNEANILRPITLPNLHITAANDEIKVPGFYSPPQDRIRIYEAMGASTAKALVVFKEGSHSMFTDRLRTGGDSLNPLVKRATQDLVSAFIDQVGRADTLDFSGWLSNNKPLISRFAQPGAKL
jgi:predicted dienelactone hydrolase